jgi:peptidoglycan/LPS O-acetylase OafA/YrhL
MRVQPGRIRTLDALRGIASVSVAWFHFTQANPALGQGILKSSGKYGWLGVDVFFVISGFVIPYSLQKAKYTHEQFWRFLAKRIVRLDPPYFVNICFVVVLAYVVPFVPGFRGAQPAFTATQLLSHFAYLNSVIGKPWVNPVFWSLGIEFQYYLLIGLIFPLLASSRRLVRTLTMGALLVSGFLVASPSLLFAHLPVFLAGILTFERKVGHLSNRSFLGGLVLTCIVAGFGGGPWIAAISAGTALVIAFIEFGGKVLTWLGLISYSLYLVHVPVGGKIVDLGAHYTHGMIGVTVVLIAATACSILAAWILYLAVELPSQRFSSRIAYSRPSVRDAREPGQCAVTAD